MAIWRFSAWPAPVTDFFTRLAAYSQAGPRRRQQHHATRSAELQGRAGIDVHKCLFDRRFSRLLCGDDGGDAVEQLAQARGQRAIGGNLDHAMRDVAQPVAFDIDHAPAGQSQTGIEADQSHVAPRQAANFASASSDSSKLA
jgi:hypothetical protein